MTSRRDRPSLRDKARRLWAANRDECHAWLRTLEIREVGFLPTVGRWWYEFTDPQDIGLIAVVETRHDPWLALIFENAGGDDA